MALHVISKSYRHNIKTLMNQKLRLNSLVVMYSTETDSRYQFIISEKVGSQKNVALVTLNRPEALNALCDDLIARLVVTVGELGANESVGAVIITGSQKALDVKNRSPRPLLNASQHLDENTFRTTGNGRRFFSTGSQPSIENGSRDKDEVSIVRKWKFLPSFFYRGYVPLYFYESQMKVKDEEIKKLVAKCKYSLKTCP